LENISLEIFDGIGGFLNPKSSKKKVVRTGFMDGKNVSGFKIFAGKERNSKEETLSRIQEKVVLKKL
jgi:hypothetical protein